MRILIALSLFATNVALAAEPPSQPAMTRCVRRFEEARARLARRFPIFKHATVRVLSGKAVPDDDWLSAPRVSFELRVPRRAVHARGRTGEVSVTADVAWCPRACKEYWPSLDEEVYAKYPPHWFYTHHGPTDTYFEALARQVPGQFASVEVESLPASAHVYEEALTIALELQHAAVGCLADR